eukprot:GHUV01051896.1.p1 GENE.GHUV01051896.1~~GHUV01051896.1.p1  ORF type:complete len:142 (-),score=17.91 GHUV01051896.1:25-450(-)
MTASILAVQQAWSCFKQDWMCRHLHQPLGYQVSTQPAQLQQRSPQEFLSVLQLAQVLLCFPTDLHLPFSHLPHSLSQLLTKLVGHTMMARLAMGLPPSAGEPCCRRVHIRVIPWRVLPRPMSSAKIQPATTQDKTIYNKTA